MPREIESAAFKNWCVSARGTDLTSGLWVRVEARDLFLLVVEGLYAGKAGGGDAVEPGLPMTGRRRHFRLKYLAVDHIRIWADFSFGQVYARKKV